MIFNDGHERRPSRGQCDQIKIAKCLYKLPKNGLTRKMNDFDSFTVNA